MMNRPSQWSEVLFGKLQTLMGERNAKGDSALRWRDLAAVYNSAALRATTISTGIAATVRTEIIADVAVDIAAVQADTDAAQAELNQLTNGLVTDINGALASIEARTRAGLNGWLADPIFARWTTGDLTTANWFSRVGTAAYASKVAGKFGSAMAVNIPAGIAADVTILAADTSGLLNANPNEPYLVLTAMLEMNAGDLNAGCFRVDWSADNVTWTPGDMYGFTASYGVHSTHGITVSPGVIQTKEVLIKRPVGAFAHVRVVIQPKANIATVAHQSVWHMLQVRPATQAEIDAGRSYSVATATPGVTTTISGIGDALAATQTALSATVTTAEGAETAAATVTANLATNYLTTAGTNTAIAAAQTVVQASIDGVAASVQGYQLQLDALADVTVGSAVTVGLNGAALGQVNTLKITEGATARVTSAPPNGASITIPQERALLFAGQRVKIGVLAKAPTTGAATKFGIVYASADGTSTYLAASANLSASWQWFTFYYNVPAAAAGGPGYLSIFGDDTKIGKSTVVARAYIDVAAVSGELPEIFNMQGSINSILGVDISTLTGTALATLLTQLSVAAGGTSAWVTSQTSAVSTLQGNAAASYSLRIGAGGASAGFEVVATDNPISGAASTIKMSAKHIELLASSVRISDSGNIYPDFDMLDPLFYTTSDGASFSFIATGTATLGRQYIAINANAAAKTVDSGWFGIEPNTEYLVSGAAFLSAGAGQGTAMLTIETGLVDAAGAVSVVTSNTIQTRTDLAYAGVLSTINLLTGATVRRARFKLIRSAGGSGPARAGGFKVQKKSGASLVVNGAIFGYHLDTASAIITGTAQIGNLVVDTINLAGRAVTLPEYSIIGLGSIATISSDTTWTDAISVSINRTGIDTLISFNGQFDGVTAQAAFHLEIWRGSTLVGSAFEAAFLSRNSFAVQVMDTDTGTGITVYTVRVRLVTGSTINGRIYQRFLHAIQYKK